MQSVHDDIINSWEMKMRTILCVLVVSFFMVSAAAKDAIKSIHVFVALCDNQSQGIVPVPKQLGNGNDPGNNLYWGLLQAIFRETRMPIRPADHGIYGAGGIFSGGGPCRLARERRRRANQEPRRRGLQQVPEVRPQRGTTAVLRRVAKRRDRLNKSTVRIPGVSRLMS